MARLNRLFSACKNAFVFVFSVCSDCKRKAAVTQLTLRARRGHRVAAPRSPAPSPAFLAPLGQTAATAWMGRQERRTLFMYRRPGHVGCSDATKRAQTKTLGFFLFFFFFWGGGAQQAIAYHIWLFGSSSVKSAPESRLLVRWARAYSFPTERRQSRFDSVKCVRFWDGRAVRSRDGFGERSASLKPSSKKDARWLENVSRSFLRTS